MRLHLVQLYSEEQSPSSAPYSIEVLAGHVEARAASWEVSMSVLDNRTVGGALDLVNLVVREGVDVLGVSVMQGTYDLAHELLTLLYRDTACSSGQPQIVLGNTLPTYRPNSFLERYPNVLIVKGFGEDSLVRILERRTQPYARRNLLAARGQGLLARYADIDNLVMMLDGARHETAVRWPSGYVIPTWVDPHRYFARVEASRGCHYDACTFCTRPPRAPGAAKWVQYPIDMVVATVKRLRDAGVTRFTFCDEDFIGNDRDRCMALAERLGELGNVPAFSFSTRVDNVVDLKGEPEGNLARRRLFEKLRDVGLSLVFCGAESFCSRQLKRYAKKSTPEGNVRAIRLLQELGLQVEVGFIPFDPFATLQDLEENVRVLDQHELWRVTSQTLSEMDVQAGAPMETWLQRRNLLISYDDNNMTYSYRFQDPVVARVAQLCRSWKQETDYAYRLVRNAQRMALYAEFPNDVMTEVKRLNFEFLKATVALARDGAWGESAAVRRRFERQREAVIDGMIRATESPRVHADVSNRLRQEISGVLGVRG